MLPGNVFFDLLRSLLGDFVAVKADQQDIMGPVALLVHWEMPPVTSRDNLQAKSSTFHGKNVLQEQGV